jgi:hypothetical protein
VENNITAVALDPVRVKFFVGDALGEIRFFSYNNFALLGVMDAHDAEVSTLVFVPELQNIFSTSWDRRLVRHSVVHMDHLAIKSNKTTTSKLKEVRDHISDVSALAISPDTRLVATGSADCFVFIYELELGPVIAQFKCKSPVTCLSWLSPYPLLAVGESNGALSVWFIADGRKIYQVCSILNNRPVVPNSASKSSLDTVNESSADSNNNNEDNSNSSGNGDNISISISISNSDSNSNSTRNNNNDSNSISNNNNNDNDKNSHDNNIPIEIPASPATRARRKSTLSEQVLASQSDGDSIVTTIFDKTTSTLFTADAGGFVHFWSLGTLLKCFQPTMSLPLLQRWLDAVPESTRQADTSPNYDWQKHFGHLRPTTTEMEIEAITRPHVADAEESSDSGDEGTFLTATRPGTSHTLRPSSQHTPKRSRQDLLKIWRGAVAHLILTGGYTKDRLMHRLYERLAIPQESLDFGEAVHNLAKTRGAKLEPRFSFRAHSKHVSGMSFIDRASDECGYNRKALVTWGGEGDVSVWDAQTGEKEGWLYQGHTRKGERLHPWNFYPQMDQHHEEHEAMIRRMIHRMNREGSQEPFEPLKVKEVVKHVHKKKRLDRNARISMAKMRMRGFAKLDMSRHGPLVTSLLPSLQVDV